MPREKLREKGVGSLSDAELIAVLLGTGIRGESAVDVAGRLLGRIGGLRGLSAQGVGSLSVHAGLGDAKAARILAAVELRTRMAAGRAGRENDPGRFACSADIYRRYGTRLALLRQEVFLVVGLSNRNEVIRDEVVAMGAVDECRVNPREVFRPLIAEACARMVAIHNHPSGDSTPSAEDIAMTRRLVEAGDLVGIPMLDHLVIGAGQYSSLRDMGLIRGT